MGILIPLVFVFLWEWLVRLRILPEQSVSKPTDIFAALWKILLDGSLLLATFQTLQAALAGICVAIVLAVPLGIILGISQNARLAAAPTFETLRPIPPVALIPLSLLIFGFGVTMEAAVVAFACVWSIMIATTAAVGSQEKRLSEVASALEMSTFSYARKIVLPAALGRIAVGIRVALGIALVVAVTVEIVVSPRGLGYGMILSQQSLMPDVMYAQLIWTGVVGWLLNWLLVSADRKYFKRVGGGVGV